MEKLAPWHPLSELSAMEAPFVTVTTTPVPLGTVTGRTALEPMETPVVTQAPPGPTTGVVCVMEVIVTGKLFGLSSATSRSALPPGTSSEETVPLAVTTVTGAGVPTLADPVPVPLDDQNA